MPSWVMEVVESDMMRVFHSQLTADELVPLFVESATSGPDLGQVLHMVAPAVGDAGRVPLRGALLFGWDDEESRAELATGTRSDAWRHGIDRIRLNNNSTQRLWGVKLKGKDSEGQEIHVVACADLANPPWGPWQVQLDPVLGSYMEFGPWQYQVPYEDESRRALLINDVLSW